MSITQPKPHLIEVPENPTRKYGSRYIVDISVDGLVVRKAVDCYTKRPKATHWIRFSHITTDDIIDTLFDRSDFKCEWKMTPRVNGWFMSYMNRTFVVHGMMADENGDNNIVLETLDQAKNTVEEQADFKGIVHIGKLLLPKQTAGAKRFRKLQDRLRGATPMFV